MMDTSIIFVIGAVAMGTIFVYGTIKLSEA